MFDWLKNNFLRGKGSNTESFHEYMDNLNSKAIVEPSAEGVWFACPCCGYQTLGERGVYEICGICNWEDDGQDVDFENECWFGPNGSSLVDARNNFHKSIESGDYFVGMNPREVELNKELIDCYEELNRSKDDVAALRDKIEALSHAAYREWVLGNNIYQKIVKIADPLFEKANANLTVVFDDLAPADKWARFRFFSKKDKCLKFFSLARYHAEKAAYAGEYANHGPIIKEIEIARDFLVKAHQSLQKNDVRAPVVEAYVGRIYGVYPQDDVLEKKFLMKAFNAGLKDVYEIMLFKAIYSKNWDDTHQLLNLLEAGDMSVALKQIASKFYACEQNPYYDLVKSSSFLFPEG